MRPHRSPCVTLAFAVLAAVGVNCVGQEVGSIDLTKVKARLDLRRPPATQATSGPHDGIGQGYDCSGSTSNAGVLRTSLASLDRTHYEIGNEPMFEVTVQNVGSAPLRIPFSPHLADLQPEDPVQKFVYSELRLSLWIAAGTKWGASSGGSILYGADDHAGTMVTLNPGEWVRISGKVKLGLPDRLSIELTDSGRAVDHAYAQVSLYHVEMLLTPTAAATVSREVCLSQKQGKSVPIFLTGPEQ